MPQSKIKQRELAIMREKGTLAGDYTVGINAKVSDDLHQATYATARLLEDPSGISGIVRKALVKYIRDVVRQVNSNDPEWKEVRSRIWYARSRAARQARERWADEDHENAEGVARELRRRRQRGDRDGMLTYMNEVLDETGLLDADRRQGVLEALSSIDLVADTMDRVRTHKVLMESGVGQQPFDPLDEIPEDDYEQEA